MPLPLILIGAAVVAGAYGVKKGVDAYSDNEEAEELNEDAEALQSKAKRRLQREKNKCTKQLKELGWLKLEAWDSQLGRFVSIFESLREVEVVGAPGLDDLVLSTDELAEMKKLSSHASEVVTGGLSAVGSGALVGMASYGGAAMFATASTGTAIGSLSGVAATNATLAWFGGGALSAGGMGMAGGMAVLGGIVAGPVLAVGGLVLAAKARENLANAKAKHAQAKKAEAEMDAARAVVKGIRQAAEQFVGVISELAGRMTSVLDRFALVVAKHGTNFAAYPEDAKREVYLAVQFAQCLKALLEASILTAAGALDDTHREALEHGRSFLSAKVSH